MRVTVIDNQPIARIGLACILRPVPGLVMAGAACLDDGPRVVVDSRPHLVILGLDCDRGPGLRVLSYLRDPALDPAVLVLATRLLPEETEPLRAAGAHRALDKRASADELVREVLSFAPGAASAPSIQTDRLRTLPAPACLPFSS